jgi:arylsulfatase A-like enzyme
MIRWPGRYKSNLQVDALIELTDLAPTLLQAAGVPIPPGIHGGSFTPLLTGTTRVHRSSVYCEYLDSQALFDPPPMATCVRTDRYKIAYYQGIRTARCTICRTTRTR